jgi:hypothetical protein
MNTPTRIQDSRAGGRKKWIGLAQVRPKLGNKALGEAVGAFVASIALASSGDDYAALVTETLDRYGFDVLEIVDVELYETRLSKHPVATNVQELAEHINEDRPVGLATFHSFKE